MSHFLIRLCNYLIRGGFSNVTKQLSTKSNYTQQFKLPLYAILNNAKSVQLRLKKKFRYSLTMLSVFLSELTLNNNYFSR